MVAMEPGPEIEPGPGRVITGLFRFFQGLVYNVWLMGQAEPLGSFSNISLNSLAFAARRYTRKVRRRGAPHCGGR